MTRVFLVWSGLTVVAYLGFLITVGSSELLVFISSYSMLSCAAVGLVSILGALMYCRYKSLNLARSALPPALVFVNAGLFAAIAAVAFYALISDTTKYEDTRSTWFDLSLDTRMPNYDDSLITPWRYYLAVPDRPTQRVFEEAYCEAKGVAYCSKLPMRETLFRAYLLEGVENTRRNRTAFDSGLYYGVIVTNATTLTTFCNAPGRLPETNIDVACDGCREIVSASLPPSRLRDWINDKCPETVAETATTFCLFYASKLVMPYLLTYEEARIARYNQLREYRALWGSEGVCFYDRLQGVLQSTRKTVGDGVGLTASLLSGFSILLASYLTYWYCRSKHGPEDEEDELMYYAMTRQPWQGGA
ncbi:hypothetical protein SDRG_15810 [Saprolegnia diclina VS20]|uniref:Uncharacterized protein n=1 Tax=Saprolegnia diclina (strain VS20) TaxID=1156394 RepID=T0PVM2_SAPDV|nr:hypothetical protein SDRG_15810 [Saprolegnia diclina VS20]EQC26321.1 hypothetical protein SDRG_15810 [Saprolegnia diclina VS20]|eukprot:XP_008620214.1 hypothetical protein SDRG_15810 [Saprolegnia diclina VS20]